MNEIKKDIINRKSRERERDNLDVPKHVSLRNLRIKLHKENFSMI